MTGSWRVWRWDVEVRMRLLSQDWIGSEGRDEMMWGLVLKAHLMTRRMLLNWTKSFNLEIRIWDSKILGRNWQAKSNALGWDRNAQII